MTVTEVGPAHAEVLAALHGRAFDAGWDGAAFVTALAQPGAFALLATDAAKQPQGFVLMRCAAFADGGGEAEVITIATHPDAHRLGVARALMGAALDRARTLGMARVFLEVAADNAAAQALYAALGFVEVGRRAAYYARANGARVDALVLALDLV